MPLRRKRALARAQAQVSHHARSPPHDTHNALSGFCDRSPRHWPLMAQRQPHTRAHERLIMNDTATPGTRRRRMLGMNQAVCTGGG